MREDDGGSRETGKTPKTRVALEDGVRAFRRGLNRWEIDRVIGEMRKAVRSRRFRDESIGTQRVRVWPEVWAWIWAWDPSGHNGHPAARRRRMMRVERRSVQAFVASELFLLRFGCLGSA